MTRAKEVIALVESTALIKDLPNRVFDFLKNHAKTSGDYDPKYDSEGDRFNGPDSSMMYNAAAMLQSGKVPERVHSDYGSGCYTPMNDPKIKLMHDALVSQLNQVARIK